MWRFIIIMLLLIALVAGVGYLVTKGVERTSRDLARSDRVSDDIDTMLGAKHVEYLQRGKNAAVQAELANVKQAYVMFYIDKGRYPKDIEELVNDRYISRGALSDPWFQEYRYKVDGDVLIITSPGTDRIGGTADDLHEEVRLR